MRRIAILSVSLASVLGAAFVGLAPAAGAAGTITVPPTVNATTWTAVTSITAAPNADQLQAVSCTTSTFCVAVGTTSVADGSVIEQWNGTTWAPVSTPGLTGEPSLHGVSCVGTGFCAAVGATQAGVLLAQQWNGTTWSDSTPVVPPSSTASLLNAVSCSSATNCEAVGTSTTGGVTTALVEQWNGTAWTIVTTPAVTGASASALRGVSCSGPSFCAATGSSQTGTVTSTLAELWNGSSWSIVASPNGSTATGATNDLAAVSCVGASFCQAVGSFSDGVNPGRTYAAQWNGSTWAQVSTPNVSGTEPDQLQGVECFSPTTCSAVGQSEDPSIGFGPVAQVWDGSTWSSASTPSLASGTVQTAPSGVSCVTNWECVAVGTTNVSSVLGPYVLSAPIARAGYRFVASDGGVFDYGAPFLGSTGGMKLNKPIVGMAVMPAGDGYDLVASDGGIFNYGSAPFYGSAGSLHLNAPIVGMAMTADGGGYWLVATDGGIFSYGDAQFYGSTGSIKLNKPIVGMGTTPDGKGYWLVASDGGIFNYGDAAFLGSAGSLPLNKPVVGMAAPLSGGYYLVASDGGIFSYPTTNGPPFFGSTGSIKLNKPIVGMTVVAGGYYLSGSDGGIFTFPTTNGPPFLGSTGSIVLNQPIVGITA